MEGGDTLLARGVRIGAVVEEELQALGVPVSRGEEERRRAVLAAEIGRRSLAE
jgi:hypothetical protein